MITDRSLFMIACVCISMAHPICPRLEATLKMIRDRSLFMIACVCISMAPIVGSLMIVAPIVGSLMIALHVFALAWPL